MSTKETNLKEKFKQALESTARVISDDLKPKENPKNNKSSNKFDFFEIDNLTSKSDFIRFRAETDSNALKKNFQMMKFIKKIFLKIIHADLCIILLKKLDMKL